MKDPTTVHNNTAARTDEQRGESGFTLAEFLISAAILLAVTSAVFTALCEIQRAASYQTEVQSVLNNTGIAMQTIARHIRQAGNDPLHSGLSGITIVSAAEMRIQSDLTGSLGSTSPDKGDPDGDTNDSGENVTIRYNSSARTLEIVPYGGSAQIVAGYISGLSFTYYNAFGSITTVGREVRKIAVAISGSSLQPNPQTHRIFGVKLCSEIFILT